MEDKSYKIYCYTNLINNKKYIGRTKQRLNQRAGKNGKKYYGCLYFGNAIKKYGWENFVGEILLDGLTYEEACQKEKDYIKLYKTNLSEYGYNLHTGGEGPSKESVEKMRESHKNKKLSEEHRKHISEGVRQGANNVNYGRKQTEIARKHYSESKSGEKHPNFGKHLSEKTKTKIAKSNSKKIKQFSLDGVFIKEWDNMVIAAEELGLNKKGINNCVRHVRHSSGGFVWIYSDPEEDAKYAENLKMLNTLGIRKMEEIKKQEKMSSTTISEKGVEQ